jgi:hypothetical protein
VVVSPYRLIRMVGDPSPWADPDLSKALVGRRVPLDVAEALAFYGKWQMQALVRGTSERVLSTVDGYSQAYRFGPHQYAVWMANDDAKLLLGNEWERWQFIDITETPWLVDRPPMKPEDWARLLESFAKLGRGRRLRPEYRHTAELPPRVALARR